MPRQVVLEYLNEHARLVVGVGGEDLVLLGGDGCVARDEDRHDAASRLQAQTERRHVEQQQILDLLVAFARQDGGLHCRPVGNGLVWVDALAQLLAVEGVLQELLDLGDARRPANEHDVVNVTPAHLGVTQALLYRLHAPPAAKAKYCISKSLHCSRWPDQIFPLQILPQQDEYTYLKTQNTMLMSDANSHLHEMVDHAVVKVLATKVRVASSGLHLKDAFLNGQQGDVERASAQVEDQHILLTNAARLLVKAICNCCMLHFASTLSQSLIKGLLLALVLDGDHRLVPNARADLEWPELHVTSNRWIRESSANQPFGICKSSATQRKFCYSILDAES
eukprot:SM000043S15810  [mRNA]  locus=s43:262059:264126:- [translate_table: standard]